MRVVMRSCLSCMLTVHGMHPCLPDAGTSWQLSRLTWKGTQHACRPCRSSLPVLRHSWQLLRSGHAMPHLAWPWLR